MAWHISKEKMNNNPLSESEVRQRFSEKGYTIIDYCYKNNMTRMSCYDKEGYKVKVSLDSLRLNVKEYARFSPSCNEENFMYNLAKYRETNVELELPLVQDWKYVVAGKAKKNRVYLKCECFECGELFEVPLEVWKKGQKTRCNACVKVESNLEIKVRHWLERKEIVFETQKRFTDCKLKRALPFDFYLPDYNTCIEVDGIQHFKSNIKLHGHLFTESEVKEIQYRDSIKTKYCIDKNIQLLRLDYTVFKNKEYIKILENLL